MWSQKVRYTFRALIALAGAPHHPVSVHRIATEYDMPEKYLESVMSELKNAGLIQSVKGPRGGYRAAFAPDELSVQQVLSVIDPQLLTEIQRASDAAAVTAEAHPENAFIAAATEPLYHRIATTTVGDMVRLWNHARRVPDYVI